jgi:phosphatidylglycerol lysyltransferase
VSAPAGDSRERARALVLAHGWNAVAYQILNPGIRHWFDPAGEAVVGWARHGRTRVVAGAPVCAEPRLTAVAAPSPPTRAAPASAWSTSARAHGSSGCGRGGPTARSSCSARSRGGTRPRGRRASRRTPRCARSSSRARNKGVGVEEWSREAARAHPVLRAVLDRWLAGCGLPPLGFLVEPRTLDHLEDRRVFVARRAAPGAMPRVVAFLVATPSRRAAPGCSSSGRDCARRRTARSRRSSTPRCARSAPVARGR